MEEETARAKRRDCWRIEVDLWGGRGELVAGTDGWKKEGEDGRGTFICPLIQNTSFVSLFFLVSPVSFFPSLPRFPMLPLFLLLPSEWLLATQICCRPPFWGIGRSPIAGGFAGQWLLALDCTRPPAAMSNYGNKIDWLDGIDVKLCRLDRIYPYPRQANDGGHSRPMPCFGQFKAWLWRLEID
ncbi:hypothetical protein Ancab_033216 [Ancistrocladus abbreviatus]